MNERRYDIATDRWYELAEDENGNLVEVAVPEREDAANSIARELDQAVAKHSREVKESDKLDTLPPSRYGRELEEAAKFAMQEEQKKGGFQDEVTTGLMLATQSPEDEKIVRLSGGRSFKQQLLTASDILTRKASEMHDKDPKLASTYSDYSQKLRSLGDQITSKFQDKWFGTNVRYNTPIGSGSEGTPYSSRFSGVNDYIRPELGGKSYSEAMNDTLETSYGKQTLANRIDERKRYMRDNPYISAIGGFFPVASQWKDMKEEGMNLEDLSATGAMQLAGSAALQSGSMLLAPTGLGTALAIGAGTASDMLARPDRADYDGAINDALWETAVSAGGGMFPGLAAKGGKFFKNTAKNQRGVSGAVKPDDPTILTKIEQNKKLVDDLNSQINEGRLVIDGNPEAMRNAFVKAAGPDIEPEQAWQYSKGFLVGPEGEAMSEQVPWVKYALKEEARLGKDLSKNIERLNKKKLAEGDAELSLRQMKSNPPTEANAVATEKELKSLQELYDEKLSTRLEDIESDIGFYKKSLETAKNNPKANIKASHISYLKSRLSALEKELSSLKTGTTKYAAKKRQIATTTAALNRAQDEAKNTLEYNTQELKRKLDRLQKEYERKFESLGREPTTAGFQTKKRIAEESKTAYSQNSEKYAMGMQKKQKELDNIKSQISDLESLISRNQEDIARLRSDETQSSFRKGAESLLKRDYAAANERLNSRLSTAMNEGERLQSSLEKSRTGRPVGGSNADERRTSRILRGFGINVGGDAANNLFAYDEHKDYNAKNDRTLGPWVDQAITNVIGKFFPSASTRRRVNRYRGFKK